jgi:NADH dehydrogenase [ubiquinone] 1 alpha subcomplex assembly factor 1
MFGPMLSDVTFHQFLGMRCRVGGSPQTRDSYFVNIQTDEVAQSTEIWQHRLYFPKGDGSWEDIFASQTRLIE